MKKGKLLPPDKLQELIQQDFEQPVKKLIGDAKRSFVVKIQDELAKYVDDFENSKKNSNSNHSLPYQSNLFQDDTTLSGVDQKFDLYSQSSPESVSGTTASLDQNNQTNLNSQPNIQNTIDTTQLHTSSYESNPSSPPPKDQPDIVPSQHSVDETGTESSQFDDNIKSDIKETNDSLPNTYSDAGNSNETPISDHPLNAGSTNVGQNESTQPFPTRRVTEEIGSENSYSDNFDFDGLI